MSNSILLLISFLMQVLLTKVLTELFYYYYNWERPIVSHCWWRKCMILNGIWLCVWVLSLYNFKTFKSFWFTTPNAVTMTLDWCFIELFRYDYKFMRRKSLRNFLFICLTRYPYFQLNLSISRKVGFWFMLLIDQ